MLTAIPLLFASLCLAQEPAEVPLKVVPIETSAKDRLLSVRVDTMGRIFLGSYDTLYVCEPKDDGTYHPRKPLYRFPERTWINDIEVRGDDVYVLTAHALYVFVDGVRKRDGLLPRKLLWGVPGGRPFAGMQKMAWGPEGDLYFTVGDVVPEGRLGYWTFFSQPAWTKTYYRGAGGVFRCKPDGTNLRVVADGLHHASNLTFDRHWNLFTSERRGKGTAEIWHVTPHARLGASDRLPPIYAEGESEFRAGPTYYDDGLLPASLRDRLLLVRAGRTMAFEVEPHGASFKAKAGAASCEANPNIWVVGRGGRLFSVYESVDMITTPDDDAKAPFEPYEASEATADKLWRELNHASWQRRYRAHIEIARRGGDLLKEAKTRLRDATASDPAYSHLIWLTAKGRQGSLHLIGLIGHADAKVRAQALRALGEFPEQLHREPIFTNALSDKDAHVRLSAMLAHFAPKVVADRAAMQAIERDLACSDDPYLRQAATLFLARRLTRKQIEAFCASKDASTRLAGVFIAGHRLTLPPDGVIAQQLPLRMRSEDGVSAIEFPDGKRDLRDNGRIGSYTIAEHWKADMHAEESELLFKLLRKMLDDADAPVRTQAARFLALLDDPRCAADVAHVLKK
ncbi:MAG TPA: hypothetical protein VFE62_24765 [Gemmataceae bacterium]|nr:hypothetical protein [Gemmataceae bacterium]